MIVYGFTSGNFSTTTTKMSTNISTHHPVIKNNIIKTNTYKYHKEIVIKKLRIKNILSLSNKIDEINKNTGVITVLLCNDNAKPLKHLELDEKTTKLYKFFNNCATNFVGEFAELVMYIEHRCSDFDIDLEEDLKGKYIKDAVITISYDYDINYCSILKEIEDVVGFSDIIGGNY